MTVAIIVAHLRSDNLSSSFLSSSIQEDGLLWQTDVLGQKAASVFTGIFSTYTAVFSGIGIGLVVVGLFWVIAVEVSERCSPSGDANEIASNDIEQLEEWVEANDEIVKEIDQHRQDAIGFGVVGVGLVISSYVVQMLGTAFVALGIILYAAIFSALWRISHSTMMLNADIERKTVISATSLILLTTPLTEYQEAYGYLPTPYVLLCLIVLNSPIIYWLRSDMVSAVGSAKNRIVGADWSKRLKR